MRRSRSRIFVRVITIAVLVASLITPAQAFAALEDEPKFESSTNPWWPNGQEVWWRDGWGNSLYPHLQISGIPSDLAENGQPYETLGFYYWVQRGSELDTETVPPINVSIDPAGALHEQTFDLEGMYADETLQLREPGTIEGRWTVWVCFYNRYRFSSVMYPFHFGYDGTNPSPIAGLLASATSNGAHTDAWTETSRRYLRWTPAVDLMSGVGVYKYELNGKFVGYVPAELPGLSSPTLTVESLPPGKTKITITPIDRATNEGPSTSVYAYVDPDVPVAKLTAPTGSVIGASPTIKASATDKAGIRNVKFYVNDKLVGTDTSAPYQVTPSLKAYANGSWLTVKVVAEDMYGHTATATKGYKLDKVTPAITSVSDSPDPFYPVLTDKYKDTSKVSFTLSENSTVYLRVYNKKGTLLREVQSSRKKGRQSIRWDGKDKDGKVRTGTFYMKLLARDAAGNVGSTGKFETHIRDYEIVRISDNAVRVIPR